MEKTVLTLVDECNAKYFEVIFDRDTLLLMIVKAAVGMVLLDNKSDGTSTAASGIAIRLEDHTADILSLYTLPEYRRQGYASTLLHTMLDVLNKNSSVLDVMMFYTGTKEHESLDGVLAANGFSVSPFRHTGITKFQLSDVSDLPRPQKPVDGQLSTLAYIDKRLLSDFIRNEPIIRGYLVKDAAVWAQEYLPCSRIYISGGRIRGLLLFSKDGEELSLDYAYIKPQVSIVLAFMLRSAITQIRTTYSPDTVITVAAKDATVNRLIKKLVAKTSWIPLHAARIDFIEYTNRFIAEHQESEEGRH